VDNGVSVLRGNGDGTFQPQRILKTGEQPSSVATGDFNRDGIADIVVANAATSSSTVSIFLGAGNGSFAQPIVLAAGSNPVSVVVGDVNQGGRGDIIVGDLDSQWSADGPPATRPPPV